MKTCGVEPDRCGVVEYVVRHKFAGAKRELLIKWVGHDLTEATWEPEVNVKKWADWSVQQYWAKISADKAGNLERRASTRRKAGADAIMEVERDHNKKVQDLYDAKVAKFKKDHPGKIPPWRLWEEARIEISNADDGEGRARRNSKRRKT